MKASQISWSNALNAIRRFRSNIQCEMPTIVVLVTVALGIQMVGVVANPLACRLLFNDLASKVVVANSVFDGELVEFNLTISDQPLDSVQWVAVFRVGAVHKGRLMTAGDRETVSVLGSKPAQVNASEERSKDRQGNDAGPCEDWKDLEVGQSYFVFLNGSSSLLDLEMVVYWASGSPHEFSKMSSKKVKRYSCETCGHLPSARLSRQGSVIFHRGQSLSLRCSAGGQPPPLIIWYRYDLDSDQQVPEVIAQSNKIRINRQGSRLTIIKAKPSDRGQYLCQAVNVLGTSNSTAVNITIESSTGLDAEESKGRLKSEYVVECDNGYCLKQGTCYIIPSLYDRFCVCNHQFTGVRCQDKRTEPEPVKPGQAGMDLINIDNLKLLLLVIILLGVVFVALFLIRRRGTSHGNRFKERKHVENTATVEQEVLLLQPRHLDVNANDQPPLLDPNNEPHRAENPVSSLVYGGSLNSVAMEPEFPESSEKPSPTNCSGSQNSLDGPRGRSVLKATLHSAEATFENMKFSAKDISHQPSRRNKDLSNSLDEQNPERVASSYGSNPDRSPGYGHLDKETNASSPWWNVGGINDTRTGTVERRKFFENGNGNEEMKTLLHDTTTNIDNTQGTESKPGFMQVQQLDNLTDLQLPLPRFNLA